MALNIPTEGTKLNELKINIVDTQETFDAMVIANKVNANELYFIEQESPITADSLKTGHTFKVNLASSNASTPFTGEQDISDIGVSGTLPIAYGGTGATSAADAPWVQKSGDTMTGVLTMKGNMYNDAYDGALNMNNSDIYKLNSIYTADASDGAAEGIHFYRDATHVDTFWVAGGDLLFVPNRVIGTNTTKANSQKISRFTANPTSGQVVITDGTTGGVKSSGYTIAASVPSGAKFTDTTYTAGTGISLSGTEFSNSGVRATTINGNYLRVNTNGNNTDLTIPYATNANKLIQDEITIQTGNTTQQHITLETLMTWLITTKQYIPSNTECYKYLPVSWAYASNDILQLSCNGTNYELQLAGCIIEFWGKATNYNTGVFRLGIHTNPAISFTANSGYTKFPASSYAEYTCNGSSYSPTWRMVTATSNSAPSLSWGTSSTIGSVNGVNLTVTMPANPNTDIKVTQNNTTAANDYRILLSYNANDTTETNTVNKNTNLRYNPSTNTLSTGNISSAGNLTITGNTNLNGETYAESVTAGSLLVNGNTNFVQIPTAPTPAATSNDTSIATTAFVMNAFTANDAMVFKGVVNTNGDLPTTHKQGWTYRVATAGSYAGKTCEVGDIIICVTDGTAANNDHWAVIQNNIDGAIYRGTNAFTDANIIVADSTNGKVKSSGKTITTTAPSSSAADTTVPTSKAVWSAISGASGYGKTGTVTSVRVQATSPVVSSSSAASSSTLDTTISLVDGYGDTKNPYGTKTANYILAGPSSGNAAVPAFRQLVAADIPNLTKSKISDFPTNISAFTNDSGYVKSSGVTSITLKAGTGISLDTDNTAITGTGTRTITNAGVIGIKGDAESTYKTGQVNLTATQIGAIPANTVGNTQSLSRPSQLNGLNDITLDSKINDLRANRLAFLPADQIIIEKTTDGGTTWTDAGISDGTKASLFSETRPSIGIPLLNNAKNVKCGLRITFTAMKYNVPAGTAETQKYNYWNSNYIVSQERYNQLKEMYFWVSSNSDTISVKAERATGANSTTWIKLYDSDENSYGMTGWSGNDYIKFSQGVFGGGTNQTGNYWNYRLTFFTRGPGGSKTTLSGTNTSSAQVIHEIRGYGDTWWGAGNSYAARDHLYSFDYLKNATFPAKVTATDGFVGNVTGNVSGSAGSIAWSGITGKPTTISGYGITDAKIANGVITLGSNTITPITAHQTVSNKGATLVWGSATTIATIGSTDIKVSLPANPNSDTKNTAGSTDTSSKIYLIGATSQAANPQTYSDNQVYTTSGQLNGNSIRIAEKITLQYDSTTQALNFVFV